MVMALMAPPMTICMIILAEALPKHRAYDQLIDVQDYLKRAHLHLDEVTEPGTVPYNLLTATFIRLRSNVGSHIVVLSDSPEGNGVS